MDDDPDWVTPRVAKDLVLETLCHGGAEDHQIGELFATWFNHETVRAKALEASWWRSDRLINIDGTETNKFVVSDYLLTLDDWRLVAAPGVERSLMWTVASLVAPVPTEAGMTGSVAFEGLRFSRADILARLQLMDDEAVAEPNHSLAKSSSTSSVSKTKIIPSDRAPAVKAGRPPSDNEILAKADELKAKGFTSYQIAGRMRHEPGFENVGTVMVRELVKGRWKPEGRPKSNGAR